MCRSEVTVVRKTLLQDAQVGPKIIQQEQMTGDGQALTNCQIYVVHAMGQGRIPWEQFIDQDPMQLPLQQELEEPPF